MRPHETTARAGIRAAVLTAAVFVTYANALDGPFIFDDTSSVVENQTIRDWQSRAVFTPDRERPTSGRPLVNASFALNYAISGLSVRSYHITNILLHAACALTLFALAQRVLRRPGFESNVTDRARDLAFAASLIWAVHPLNSEVVDYITQRTESMMALFYLLTMFASARAFDSRRAGRWSLIAVACCALGMACKESMVTAPILVALHDRVFLFSTWRNAWARRRRLYLGLLSTLSVLWIVMRSGPRVHSAGFSSGVSPLTYLLNQTGMITQYLRLGFWPRALVLNYGPPVEMGFADVIPVALVVLTLLALTGVALARWPAYGFFGAWFFITLAPTTTIVPIATEVGAERRMYLPLMALMILFVIAASRLREKVRSTMPVTADRQRVAVTTTVAVVALLSAALSALTMRRNLEYRSSVAMAETVVERWPTPAAHTMLGIALEAADRHDEAVRHLRAGADGYSRAHYHLGGALFNHHQTDEAIRELEIFLQQSPQLVEAVSARMILSQALIDRGRLRDATAQLRQVLIMRPSQVDALGLLADCLFAQQELDEALARYSAYLASRPTDIGALINVGVANSALGRTNEAKAAFLLAIDVNPRDVRVHRNLASLALNAGDVEGGKQAAQRAVALDGQDAVAHDLLGRALGMQGELAGARAEFEKALAIDPSFEQARADLARVRLGRQ